MAGDEIKIDRQAFFRKAQQVVDAWKSSGEPEEETLRGVDCAMIMMGGANEEVSYSKTAALHTWLLGYEFPSTLILATPKGLTFVTSSTKAKFLEPLTTGKGDVQVEVLKRTKDDAENEAIWKKLLGKAEGAKHIGVFAKDKQVGKVAEEWQAVYSKAKAAGGWQEKDVSPCFGALFAVKDEDEIKNTRTAAKLASGCMSKYFVEEMTTILDEGRKTTHEKLAAKVENQLDEPALWKRIKGIDNPDMSLADWCYTPIIQSGGDYNLKTSAQSNASRLEGGEGGGVVLASIGMKYRNYCANIGRTWLIDPDKTQERNFKLLLELQAELCEKYLKPETTFREVYEKAQAFVRSRDKDGSLAPAFLRNLGFVIGIEFRDGGYVIQAKNERKLKRDMTLSLQVGFEGLDDPKHKGRKYALLLLDTVRVTDGGATFLSDRLKSTQENIFLNDESDEEDKEKDKARGGRGGSEVEGKVTAGGKVLRSKGRRDNVDQSISERIKDHQKELAQQRHEDGLSRYADDDGEGGLEKGKTFKKFEAYKKDWAIPAKSADLKIHVDHKAQAVVLPIHGFAVPYHINTIKNVSKSEEGDFTYLRFNFITPGQIAGKKEDVPFEDPDATFIRSMSFRSSETGHINELFREITEMKKAETKRAAEKKELADVVEQDRLVLSKGRTSVLRDVFPRPALEGKRLPGDVEIHENGVRFQSRDGRTIDVLFNNVKHLFWQSSEGELIVLVHFHLKAPIMIGKRKTKDVQFYREASNVAFDETGNRKRRYRAGDEDEIEMEQEERRLRRQLDKEFKMFAQRIADSSEGRITLDSPYRELGFQGVPSRSAVLMAPTTDCLVHLTEPPFVVVTVSEVEICHLERVSLSAQTSGSFDMVFVFSELNVPPLTIRSVPLGSLDHVKEWLDSVDILISEGPVNLNWTAIIKQVREDPYGFYSDGGWGFLLDSGSDSEGSGSEEEEESDFSKELSEAELYGDESDDDESGSDFDEDASDDEGSGFDEDDVTSGEDWDEMEKKAAKADRKRGGSVEEEDGGKRKGGKRR